MDELRCAQRLNPGAADSSITISHVQNRAWRGSCGGWLRMQRVCRRKTRRKSTTVTSYLHWKNLSGRWPRTPSPPVPGQSAGGRAAALAPQFCNILAWTIIQPSWSKPVSLKDLVVFIFFFISGFIHFSKDDDDDYFLKCYKAKNTFISQYLAAIHQHAGASTSEICCTQQAGPHYFSVFHINNSILRD